MTELDDRTSRQNNGVWKCGGIRTPAHSLVGVYLFWHPLLAYRIMAVMMVSTQQPRCIRVSTGLRLMSSKRNVPEILRTRDFRILGSLPKRGARCAGVKSRVNPCRWQSLTLLTELGLTATTVSTWPSPCHPHYYSPLELQLSIFTQVLILVLCSLPRQVLGRHWLEFQMDEFMLNEPAFDLDSYGMVLSRFEIVHWQYS